MAETPKSHFFKIIGLKCLFALPSTGSKPWPTFILLYSAMHQSGRLDLLTASCRSHGIRNKSNRNMSHSLNGKT